MATTPTQDPVASESPRDLKFNAGKIDEFVSSMGWTYTDRFGNKHYTIEGINYLAQQVMSSFGYVTLAGVTFTTGATLNNPNEVLFSPSNNEYYKWTGSYASGPKVVPENSTPESSGGIGPGKWLAVGSASLDASDGASRVGTTNGKSVQENIDFLEYANGVRISEYLDQPDPINAALNFARGKKLHVVVDTDLTFTNPILLYNTDRIYDFGSHTLTKSGNGIPNPAVPSSTAPERGGRLTDFNKDAAIIIIHPSNSFALRNVIEGLRIVSNERCEYAIYAPFFAHHVIRNCMFYGFKQGIRSFDAYAHVWDKIYCNYWYSPGGSQDYSDLPCYQIEDESYGTGTSGTVNNVTSIFYRCAHRWVNRNYTTLTSCGGEGINKPTSSSSVPYVFELINCNQIILNSPYTENLSGGFFKVINDSTATSRGGSIVINGPQANAGIRGTTTSVGAKLFDVSGNANVVVNGGYFTTAASGYFLDLYRCNDDSYLRFIASDFRFSYVNLSGDTNVYTGIMKIDAIYSPEATLNGVNTTSTYSGVVPFKVPSLSSDRFNQSQNLGYVRTVIPGIYEAEAEISFPAGSGTATVAIKNSASPTDTGASVAIFYHNLNSSGRSSVRIKYRGRVTSNRYLYVSVSGQSAQSLADADTSFTVKMP